MSGLVWSFRSVGSQTVKYLYRNSSILQHLVHFSVSKNFQTGEIYLNIKGIKPVDAGVYTCITAGVEYSAYLVIMGT